MGKKKNNSKKNKVFQVAGSRALKAKKKAQPVQGQLKKMAEFNRKKIVLVDKEMSGMQEEIRQKVVKEIVKAQNKLKQAHKSSDKVEESASGAMDKLNQLEMK